MLEDDDDDDDDSVRVGKFVFWNAAKDSPRKATLFAFLTVAWRHWRRFCPLRCDYCAVTVVVLVVF